MLYYLKQLRNYFSLSRSAAPGVFAAFVTALRYRFPSRRLFVVGVIGDESATVIAELSHHLLTATHRAVGTISKKDFLLHQSKDPIKEGMSEATNEVLQRFLRIVADADGHYAFIVLSAQDLGKRIYQFIDFDAVIFARWPTGEHERLVFNDPNKLNSVEIFLQHLVVQQKKYGLSRSVIIDRDEPAWREIVLEPDFFTIGYRLEAPPGASGDGGGGSASSPVVFNTTILPESLELMSHGSRFVVHDVPFETRLIGRHSVSYILAALASLEVMRIPLADVAVHLITYSGLAGHLEYLDYGQAFDVIVDEARTPEELRSTMSIVHSLQSERPTALLLCVIGASGSDTEEVRREKAKVAGDYCNRIFLTVADPGEVKPSAIINSLKEGLPFAVRDHRSTVLFWELPDRKRAIERALEIARPQDIIFIPGKVGDQWMDVGPGERRSWDERSIIREAIKRLPGR